ncbi:MAG: histidinol dehydrogenase, partial [Desulfobaccales bacterium]
MPDLQVEHLSQLTPARRRAILSRSQEDVSAVREVVAPILAALRRDGDAESLRQHGQFKAGITAADLVATPVEIEAAYRALDPPVLAALTTAAANIEKFHQAQREREMWALEVRPGILAGRLIRPLARVGCYIPGGLA